MGLHSWVKQLANLVTVLAGICIGARPQIRLGHDAELHGPLCGMTAFSILNSDSTMGEAKIHFSAACEEKYAVEVCAAAAIEFWKGQDLTDPANPPFDSAFCQTLRLAHQLDQRGALPEQAIPSLLERGTEGKKTNGGDPAPAPAPAPTCSFGGVVNDEPFYEQHANSFIGLNPRRGTGSGFFHREATWKDTTFGTAPETNGKTRTRTDLCTCDCKASPDGVGCVGYGGIAFRYTSLLAKGCDDSWHGQMVAMDCGAARGGKCNVTDPEQSYFQFIGEDLRASPGGEAIYSVATSLDLTNNGIGGNFRQANDAVSCAAAIQDESDFLNSQKDAADSCFAKCGSLGQYAAWLEYCKQETDTSAETGFKGRI